MGKVNSNRNIDYKQGYLLALDNAKKHLEVALVSKHISLGIANSHLILATEEAIKADILYKITVNPAWLEHTSFDEYFRNHKYKHTEGSKSQLLNSFLSLSLEKWFEFGDRMKNSTLTKEKKKKFIERLIEKSSNWVEEYSNEARQKHLSNEEWWKAANGNKNLGFYVNLDKRTSIWKGPFDITQEQFDKSFEIVSEFISDVEDSKLFLDD